MYQAIILRIIEKLCVITLLSAAKGFSWSIAHLHPNQIPELGVTITDWKGFRNKLFPFLPAQIVTGSMAVPLLIKSTLQGVCNNFISPTVYLSQLVNHLHYRSLLLNSKGKYINLRYWRPSGCLNILSEFFEFLTTMIRAYSVCWNIL